MFARDAVQIMQNAQTSPEQAAFTLMFAVATANCPFMQSVDTMPILRRKFYSGYYLPDAFTQEERSIMGCAYTSQKHIAYVLIWTKRHEIYAKYRECLKNEDHLAFWHYCMDELRGMAVVKAAFAVQMMFNKLGCIDIHNARELGYSKAPEGKSKKAREAYLAIQSVKSSDSWWDDWCAALAEKRKLGTGDRVSRLHAGAVLGFAHAY